jgi:aspartate-semialdehyde dehydrogenase
MAAGRLLRVAVVGATGAVGSEVIALLASRRFPLQELLPIATERSLGASVELLGHDVPVETEVASLRGFDLVLVCTPAAEALAWLRVALRDQVPCIDLSGSVAATPEVPLLVADRLPDESAALSEPVLASPGGGALAWVRVLGPIRERAGLRRVVATTLESVSGAGRAGILALEAEIRALFGDQDAPEPSVFAHGIAFDCLPAAGTPGDEGTTAGEAGLARDVARLLAEAVPIALTSLRIPAFAGSGAALSLETVAPLAPAECAELLAKTPGVTLFEAGAAGPSTRDTIGRDDVLVGRIRRDPSSASGLLLWIAADPIRLAALNALRLAEARFQS